MKADWGNFKTLILEKASWGALGLLLPLLLGVGKAAAFSERLFFVGEDVRVLTAASRWPEKPQKAPAIAEVIPASFWRERGLRTLAEVLAQWPGFYMDELSEGTRPFLRGLPNGFLILYDGVPLTSDSTKNVHPLDEELSLDHVERIEIIRGPSSTLWGPDAFEGVVNVVPRHAPSDRYVKGQAGAPYKDLKLSLGRGFSYRGLSGYLGASYRKRDPFKEYYRFKTETEHQGRVGQAEFWEGIFKLQNSWLDLTARFSAFRRPFVFQDLQGMSWPGQSETPINLVKASFSKKWSHTALKLWGYYHYLKQRRQELSLVQQQKNHLFYGEILFRRDLFSRRALLTVGGGYRENQVRDAAVRVRGYFPSFLEASTKQFWPLIDTADFNTRLTSIFFQYRHHLTSKLDFWFGFRWDDHNQYSPGNSYNLGFLYQPRSNLYFKLLWGTSYRTPYSHQFLQEKVHDPEEVRALSGELYWRPLNSLEFRILPYFNRVAHYIQEDVYGGYSRPLKRYFLGTEISLSYRRERFQALFSFSWHHSWGDQEVYKVLDYITIIPGEPPEFHYSFYQKPFCSGPEKRAYLDLFYRLSPKITLSWRFNYFSEREVFYLKEGKPRRLNPSILVNFALRWRDVYPGLDLVFKVENLFNRSYLIPDKYALIPVPGTRLFWEIEKRW